MKKLKVEPADFSFLARVLKQVEFFAPMTIGQLEMILPYILLYHYDAGEKICRQGDEGDAFYIVRDGKVSVLVKKGFFSFAKVVAELGVGQFFGEMALVTREPRSATVVCEQATRVFVLSAVDFSSVLKQNSQFAEEIQKIVKRRQFLTKHESQ